MSRNEWEEGRFKLPTAEFTKLRKKLEQVDKANKQRVFDHTQKFWKGLSAKEKRDKESYREAVRRYCQPSYSDRPFGRGGYLYPHGLDEPSSLALQDTLRAAEYSGDGQAPRRVLKTDMDFPTNRTTSFKSGEAHISFDREKSTVGWHVGENNHAVDSAKAEPLAHAFFDGLHQVRWTRDTGGEIVGNDEFNEDNRQSGGGANYTTFAIGPLGERNPFDCVEYLDGKGKRRTRSEMFADFEKERKRQERAEAKYRRQLTTGSGGAGRVQRGVSSGGQFSGRTYTDADIRL